MNKLQIASLFRLLLLALILLGSVIGVSSCRAKSSNETAPLSGKMENDFFLLDLIGYNYTDHYIDNYSVNGQGGGNVMVSSPTSGGSGVACCLKLMRNTAGVFRIRVRWQSGGCTYITKSQVSGSVFENIHPFYKQAEVDVRREDGIRPKFLEVHFYADGSVQAQLTEDFSLPRLEMDETRADKTPFPKCKDDKKPL